MDDPLLAFVWLLTIIDGLTKHIEQTAQGLLTNRNLDAGTGCNYLHISAKTITGCQHDTAHRVATDMLCHFHDQFFITVHDLQCVLDMGKFTIREFHVYDGSHDLYDFSLVHFYNHTFP